MNRIRLYPALTLLLLATSTLTASAQSCPTVQTFAPGVISTDDHWEWRLTFSPSRKQAYWATSVGWWPGTREQAFIKTSDFRAGSGWSQPRVASFSGIWSDFDPFLSPDGQTLYFSSMRPVDGAEKEDMDLWRVRRTNSGWGTPEHLGPLVNAEGYDELYSSVDERGNLFFARVKAPIPTEDVEIWRAERHGNGYAAPVKLGSGVNTPERWEFNPEISPDGRTLLFVRLDLPWDEYPDQGYGFGDIYVSHLERGRFGEAINLGACINSANDEFHPTMDWKNGTLYFAQDAGAPSDFHFTPVVLPH